MRFALVLFLLAAVATAKGRGRPPPPPTERQVEHVRRLVGAEAWGRMPEWRRKNVVDRYMHYLNAPEEVRRRIEKKGLGDYLTRPSRRAGKPQLPPEIATELEALNPRLRRLAGKLAVVRLRQLRFDRNLALVARAERRRWFERLFPEPFDPAAARDARLKFERVVAASVAQRLKPQLRALSELPPDQRRKKSLAIVREYNSRQERGVVQSVARQVRRLRGVAPEDARRRLSSDAALVLDRRDVFATPRQRELIRWALRPHACPLLDFSWMGSRPEGKAQRRDWDRDVRAIGRLSLLSEAGLPKETVLQLASAGSDEEFLGALRGLIGRGPPAPA
ncbi:MAG: hypothetical protein ACYTGZ_21745, partial [Planctomycetota bacterium]